MSAGALLYGSPCGGAVTAQAVTEGALPAPSVWPSASHLPQRGRLCGHTVCAPTWRRAGRPLIRPCGPPSPQGEGPVGRPHRAAPTKISLRPSSQGYLPKILNYQIPNSFCILHSCILHFYLLSPLSTLHSSHGSLWGFHPSTRGPSWPMSFGAHTATTSMVSPYSTCSTLASWYSRSSSPPLS